MARDLKIREERPHRCRPQEGDHPDPDLPEAVGEHLGDDPSGVGWSDANAAALHEPAAEGEPLRAVVVAADRQDPVPCPGEPHQEAVEKADCLCGRDGPVVDVPRDQHRVGLFLVRDVRDPPQDVGLILDHTVLVHPLAQVKV